MTESAQAPAPTSDLEARIAAFEKSPPSGDFDAAGWVWIVLLGVAVPVLMLAVGWWA